MATNEAGPVWQSLIQVVTVKQVKLAHCTVHVNVTDCTRGRGSDGAPYNCLGNSLGQLCQMKCKFLRQEENVP